MLVSQEQKVELQTQSKDSYLKQLGEVEQRFGTVSRQTTVLKQAHDRLQENGTIRWHNALVKEIWPIKRNISTKKYSIIHI